MQQEQMQPQDLIQEFSIEQLEQRVEFGLCGGGNGGGSGGTGGGNDGGNDGWCNGEYCPPELGNQ